MSDLISRTGLRRSLMIWHDRLTAAGECGGCEAELLQAVVKLVDAQKAALIRTEGKNDYF